MVAVSFWQAIAAAYFFLGLTNAQDSKPTGPTHPKIASNCNAFHTIVSGDACWSVETKYGITHANFIKWNPDVSDDCLTNFWLGYSYCVGVGAVVSTSSTRSTSSSSRTSSSIASRTSTMSSSKISSSSSRTTSSSSRTSTTSSSITSRTSTMSSSKISTTATTNATYSIREPIVTWNVSTSQVETAFPPRKTQAGQPSYCTNWHFVVAGETCQEIVGSATWATMEQFLQWNSALGSDCSGLYDGWWVCIAIQPQSVTVTFDYTVTAAPVEVPDPTAHTPTVFSTANSSFIASPTPAGLASNCKAFYQAQSGDTCRKILQYGLFSQEQFFSWNPALNGNCDGLWIDYYYCVAAGDSRPDPPTTTTRPASVPQGQVKNCVSWYQVDESENCDEIVSMFGKFSKSDFISWNPSVGSSCGDIVAKQFLCVAIPGAPTTRTASAPAINFPAQPPTQSGIVSNCSELWLVSKSDSCSSIAKSKGITEAQLLTWNPALGSSACTGLTPNFYICVAVGGKPVITTGPPTSAPTSTRQTTTSVSSTRSSTTTSAGGAIKTPTPTQDGMVTGCRRFYLAQSGNGCWAIANSAGIDLNDFYKWNPAVGTSCGGLWLDTWYCIGIAGPVTTISSGPPVPT